MWLETITLVTLESSKTWLSELNREIEADARFQELRIESFCAQHTELHICWHLHHPSVFNCEYSVQAEMLIELASDYGPVHYLYWHPFERKSD